MERLALPNVAKYIPYEIKRALQRSLRNRRVPISFVTGTVASRGDRDELRQTANLPAAFRSCWMDCLGDKPYGFKIKEEGDTTEGGPALARIPLFHEEAALGYQTATRGSISKKRKISEGEERDAEHAEQHLVAGGPVITLQLRTKDL